MATLIEELVLRIKRGGDDAREAALTLGLLIERERVHRPPGDDGGIEQILGQPMAARRLSEDELATAVALLLAYVRSSSEPHITAVWALNKSHDPATVPALIDLLDRIVDDQAQEHLAYQALQGILVNGLDSRHARSAAGAIKRAAERGHGEVRELAASRLASLGTPYEDENGR